MADDPKETRDERRARKELKRRMLAVEDTIEMKTEEGSEMLIPATPEEIAEDQAAFEEDLHKGTNTPAGAMRRKTGVHIRGVGEVSS